MNSDEEGTILKDAATPSSANEAIAIHTMQDDLVQARRQPPPRTMSPKPATQPTDGLAPPTSQAPALPLPPKPSTPSDQKKIILEPRRSQRARRWPLFVASTLLILVLLGSGIAAWQFLGLGPQLLPGTPDAETEQPTVALDVLPADAALILRYQVDSSTARSAILSAWERTGSHNTNGATTALLSGDPRSLLSQDASLTELYYVLLAGESRPYLVVPKNDVTTSVLANNPDVVLMEQTGWYIAHAVSVQTYQGALASGTLASRTDPVLVGTSGSPLQLLLGPALVREARRTVGGNRLIEGNLQEVVLTADLNQATSALLVSGDATTLKAPQANVAADQQLLALIPSTAQFIRLGANFAQDAKSWAQLGTLTNPAALTELAVLNQLSTPYAFYRDGSLSSNGAYGFIIKRPTSLGSITLDDPALIATISQLKQFVVGQRTLAPIEFNQATIGNLSLRYANLNGPTQALDYVLTDQYLLISTSKDTMLNLINATTGNIATVTDNPAYQSLLTAWGALPAAPDVLIGIIDLPLLRPLLPLTSGSSIPFGLAFTHSPESDETTVTGALLLNGQP